MLISQFFSKIWVILFIISYCFGPYLEQCRSDDWPQWLGPTRDAIWRETGIIARFPENGPKLRWKSRIGSGYSGPSVSNGRVFVMDRIEATSDPAKAKLLHEGRAPQNINFVRRLLPGKERVICLDEASGEQHWVYEYDCPYTTVAAYAIGPRTTPAVDGDRVYTLGAEGHLFCLGAKTGKVVWSRDFCRDYGLKVPEWGMAAHPLMDGEKLICMVGGEGSNCVAFDKRTGRELWRALDAKEPGYCPPVIYDIGGRRQLIAWNSDQINGLDPETGKAHWSLPFEATFAMAIGMPRFADNSLFVMAYNRKSARIQLAEDGLSASLAWRGNTGSGVGGVLNTAFIENGHIFACGQGGRYICVNFATGERLWETFQPTAGGRRGSWANVFTVKQGDRFFLANDIGDLVIARMNPEGYRETSRTHLIEPTHKVGSRMVVWSHPAFANRSVYLRNDKEIRCYSLSSIEAGKLSPQAREQKRLLHPGQN